MKRWSKIGIFLFLLCGAVQAGAADDPDELYRRGRFAEAEKVYAQQDMDHPRDIRYRYNRGCAAYQKSDYQAAMAAFASALRRAEDVEMRFKSAYNLGNTAYKQGDFRAAADFFKQAVAADASNENARHNLELALRALLKEKEKESADQDKQSGEKGGEGTEQSREQKDTEKETCGEENPDKSPEQDKREKKRVSEPGREGEPEPKGAEDSGQDETAAQDSLRDLSGELKTLEELREQGGEDKEQETVLSGIDKKRAEALLDNIREDMGRVLRFQVPREKSEGVGSGKDW